MKTHVINTSCPEVINNWQSVGAVLLLLGDKQLITLQILHL